MGRDRPSSVSMAGAVGYHRDHGPGGTMVRKVFSDQVERNLTEVVMSYLQGMPRH